MAIDGNLLSDNAESVETDASAWQAASNATALARGTGGTRGSHCLTFKSVAAGDALVSTVSKVDVVAGAEYWACASVFPPAAGDKSLIGIRWYTSTGTLISTSTGPLTTAPAATWHQVAVIGVAPANAATADIVVRVTATAASQSWYTDRHYLGRTAKTPGNLLSFAAESVEADITGWYTQSGWNSTLSVATSSYTWFQALRVTASAAGATYSRSTETPAVVEGEEYVGYCYVTPSAAGVPFRIAILWRSQDGSSLATSWAEWTPSTGGWTRCVVVATAPPGAVSARLTINPIATAAGQSWVCDRMVLAPTSELLTDGNLLSYNASSFEQDLSAWTVTGGTATQTTEQILAGAYAMKMTATGGTLTASTVVPVSTLTDTNYEFVPCSLQLVEAQYRTQIEWLDENGGALRTRWQTWGGRTTGWLGSSMGDLAPSAAVAARLSFIVPDAAPGDVWYLDRIHWGVGGLTAEAEPTPDGSGVSITVRGLTAGGPSWLWSLMRLSESQVAQPVRGWTGDLVDQPITGDIAVATDYECPLGVPVQWRVSVRNSAGAGAWSFTSDPVTLPAESTDIWLKDPGLPQRSARVTVAPPLPTWRTTARQGVSQVRGRRLPVVISDVRGGRTGDLTVVTETAAERSALDWVLEAGSVLLLQWPPHWGEEDIYVSVGDVSAAPVADFAEFHDRTWTLPLTEVERPIGGVTGSATRTWQTVADAGSSWADVLAGKTTWLDIYTGA